MSDNLIKAGDIGIYAIVHRDTGHAYVGSSSQLNKRWRLHRLHLRRGSHHSPRLQRAWTKHGEDSFSFLVLLRVNLQELIAQEQRWLDLLIPAYNARPRAESNRGYRHSEETKKKIGQSNRGRVRTPEDRAAISSALKGRQLTTEQLERLRRRCSSPEVREKMAQAKRGSKQSSETIQKRSAALKGHLVSEETRVRISIAKRKKAV